MAKNGVKTIIEIKAKGEKELKSLTKSLTNQKEATKDLVDTTNLLLKSTAMIGYISTIKNAVNAMTKLSKKQIEYIEDLNLLDVAYGNANNSGKKLINTMSDIIGLDQQSLVKSLGVYKQMSSAMGIASNASALLSENLLKMQTDISSLYNLDFERAGQILQVTMSGNTKSIRALGGDITETSLAQTALNLGITKSISEMNRAEKTILIYLTLERQLANANGDLSRTINSVSNQTKIMREQWNMLTRQLGSVFIPVLQKILPYLNAILMTTNTIISSILGLLGIDAESWADSFGIASGYVDDLGDSINNVTSANEKLNKSLRSWDKLNNIKTPDSSGSGGVGGIGNLGGIDSSILAQLKEYNLHLDNAKNKAKKIADKMRELLGFHQELNEETGQWEWKYGGIGESLKNIYTNFKNLNPKTKIFVGFMTLLAGKSLFNNINNLITLFGKTKLAKNMLDAVTPTQLLVEQLSSLKKMGNLSFGNIGKTLNDWSSLLTITEKLQTTLIGSGGVVLGFKLAKESAINMAEEGVNATNILSTSLSGLAGIIGGGLAGASIGGATGGIIGAVLGGLTTIWSYMDTTDTLLNTNMKNIQEHSTAINSLYKEWQQSVETLNETFSKSDAESQYYQKLWTELKSITDENGKIQSGYETRATFITNTLSSALGIEIDVVDGVVQKYGELETTIDTLIAKKTAMIKLNSLEEEAQTAIENVTQARKNESIAYENLTNAQEKYEEKLKSLASKYDISYDSLKAYMNGTKDIGDIVKETNSTYGITSKWLTSIEIQMKKQSKALKEAQKNYDKASETLQGYNNTISDWEYLTQLSLDNNYEAMNLYFDHERNLRDKDYQEQNDYWDNILKDNTRYLEDLERNRSKYDETTYNSMKKSYEEQISLANTKMGELKFFIDTINNNISDDTIDTWGKMGQDSVNDFMTYFKQLPSNIQTEIVDKMKAKGYSISEELQEGINSLNVKVNVNADTNGFVNAIKKAVKAFGGQSIFNLELGGGSRASGGFVEKGQIFQANEKGPEMVGTMDGKTAVANTSQITTGIRQATRDGMLDAFMASGSKNVNVTIVAEGDADGLLDFITFKQKQRDRQYDL